MNQYHKHPRYAQDKRTAKLTIKNGLLINVPCLGSTGLVRVWANEPDLTMDSPVGLGESEAEAIKDYYQKVQG